MPKPVVEGVTGDLAPVVVHFASMSSPNRLVKTGCGRSVWVAECRRRHKAAVQTSAERATGPLRNLTLAVAVVQLTVERGFAIAATLTPPGE